MGPTTLVQIQDSRGRLTNGISVYRVHSPYLIATTKDPEPNQQIQIPK